MSQSQSVSPLDLIDQNLLPKDELVGIVLAQQNIIDQLKQEINQLQKKIEKLKVSRDLDSKTSSKPPSTDLPKKSEKAKPSDDNQTSHKSFSLARGTARTSRKNPQRYAASRPNRDSTTASMQRV